MNTNFICIQVHASQATAPQLSRQFLVFSKRTLEANINRAATSITSMCTSF